METKYTILSRKDKTLLEKVILRCGSKASLSEIRSVFLSEYKDDSNLGKRITFLSKQGWLVKLKGGLYYVNTDITTLNATSLSLLTLANYIVSDSYVSFAMALNYYNMFDQLVDGVDSVAKSKTNQFNFQGKTFRYFHVKAELFFGYQEVTIENKITRVAEKEKIIIDYLYLKRNESTVSMIREKLSEFSTEFDFEKLIEYATQTNSQTVIKSLGVILDFLKQNSDSLARHIKKTGYSRLTKESKLFNAKWRIYYDDRILK